MTFKTEGIYFETEPKNWSYTRAMKVGTLNSIIDNRVWPSGLGRWSRKFGLLELETAKEWVSELGQKEARKRDLNKNWAGNLPDLSLLQDPPHKPGLRSFRWNRTCNELFVKLCLSIVYIIGTYILK